jgi:hypothetical protein
MVVLSTEERLQNAASKISVVHVVPLGANDDTVGNDPCAPIVHHLQMLGYICGSGTWSSERLLGKLPLESVDTVYVVHNHNVALAERLVRALVNLRFAPRVVTLTTREASAASVRIAASRVLEYCDALVAYRPTA